MSFLERAKQAAEQARQAAVETTEKAHATLRDPATANKAKATLGFAKRGFSTAVERIDPGILADVIIKATALQEKANAALRDKGSPYRIAEIAIGASIPPSVTFSIGRTEDPAAIDEAPPTSAATLAAVAQHLGESDGTTIVTLDGTHLDEADLSELA